MTASRYPFPTVCHDKQSTDWFNAIARTLKWNERQRQKSFVVVEEAREKPRTKEDEVRDRLNAESQQEASTKYSVLAPQNYEKNETRRKPKDPATDDDQDDGEYDIKDSSGEASRIPPAGISDSSDGAASPGRFGVAPPHPPPVHSRHRVDSKGSAKGSAKKTSHGAVEDDTDADLELEPNEPARYKMRRAAGEVGERDHLRESAHTKGKLKHSSSTSSRGHPRTGSVTWSDQHHHHRHVSNSKESSAPDALASQLERINENPSMEHSHRSSFSSLHNSNSHSLEQLRMSQGSGPPASAVNGENASHRPRTRTGDGHSPGETNQGSSESQSPTGPVAFAVLGTDFDHSDTSEGEDSEDAD